jgi:hypothetical protein
MNDYCSDFPKPAFAQRFKECMAAIPDDTRSLVTHDELEKIVTVVVENDKDYSYSGYYTFGRKANANYAIYDVKRYASRILT